MPVPNLNLVVIRGSDIDGMAEFYSALGCVFKKHRHGNGPEHYVAENMGVVFEIYPQSGDAATTETRLGFQVTSVDGSVEAALAAGGRILSEAKDSEWGRRAVVLDPSGHKVELVS